jgi:hypothetical protein
MLRLGGIIVKCLTMAVLVIAFLFTGTDVLATSGRTDPHGGHHDKKHGKGYHVHPKKPNGGKKKPDTPKSPTKPYGNQVRPDSQKPAPNQPEASPTAPNAAPLSAVPKGGNPPNAPQQKFRPAIVKSTFEGHKYIKDNTIWDPNYADAYGTTNLQRIRGGRPPIGNDGEPVQIHHVGQKQDGTRMEVLASEHRKIRNPNPSEIDRPEFASEKRRYWMERAIDFE